MITLNTTSKAINEKLQGLYVEGADISLYVADLGAYVSGELRGVWVSLPLDEDEMEALYDMADELAIHDFECDFMRIGEYSNIRDLNDIAERLDALYDTDKEVFKAYLREVSDNVEDALTCVKNSDYVYYYDCNNMEDVAYHYIHEICGGIDYIANKEYYFDAESFGRDLSLERYNPYMTCGCYQDDCEECQEAIRMEEDGEIDYTETAEQLLEDGCIDDETLERYFDYEAYGRDLDLGGCSTFVFLDNGDCVEFF